MGMIPPSIIPTDRYGIIYLVTHRESGQQYVGQTIRELEERWRRGHVGGAAYRRGKERTYIMNAITKHGPEAFIVETLDWAASKAELDQKERFWIAFLDTQTPEGYNIKDGGANGRPHPDAVAKRAAKLVGRKLHPSHPFCRKGRVSNNKGKKMPPEAIEANRAHALTRFASGWKHPMQGRKHTEESRRKMSASLQGPRLGRRRPITCVETGQTFDGAVTAAEWIAAQQGGKTPTIRSHLCQVLNKPNRTAGGYHWISAPQTHV